jgi:lipoprotein-anchoring transpeptidase ErfK/SrfK
MNRTLRLALFASAALLATAAPAFASQGDTVWDLLANRNAGPATMQSQTRGIPREVVPYAGAERPGTIIVNTTERRLYLVMEGGRALRYGIGVGREGFQWQGEQRVTRMAEWPDWTPPPEMIQRRPDLPRFMPGGPSNPLGARALYLGSTLYRIHGSNEPHTIGQAVSSGCIRMTNDDVAHLYAQVRVGARVVVTR